MLYKDIVMMFFSIYKYRTVLEQKSVGIKIVAFHFNACADNKGMESVSKSKLIVTHTWLYFDGALLIREQS